MLSDKDKHIIQERIEALKKNQNKFSEKYPPHNKKDKVAQLQYSSAGFELMGHIIVFAVIGYYLDKHFNSSPWLLTLMMISGMISGMIRMIQVVKKIK